MGLLRRGGGGLASCPIGAECERLTSPAFPWGVGRTWQEADAPIGFLAARRKPRPPGHGLGTLP